MSNIAVYALGFLAQGFFSARMLIQWIMSERAKKIVSPNIYWICSLAGSVLLFIYGWLRNDFSIIFGQLISYYIYIWNLNIKGVWPRLPLVIRGCIFALPIVAVSLMLSQAEIFVQDFFHNSAVPLWLLVFGSAGQFIFTIRFIYQWYYSYRRHASYLPVGFWIISLVGSGIIVAYGIFRLDPVLIIGQSVGFITYTRNIMLGKGKSKKVKK
ncbi:MAG: lipid-A-disaccharide synthase N-terminal domain-containing protein [Prevotellaceae bacterium]|nr:lipid-A-disaccharide synthase N-terminal domain-containing protein [Prevotellaceae bacterium]